ncbi:MAG: beta-N-acetylhexosaminidase [Betaproteobacteria bacterium AqS2]|uniref:beta-N-acetylhexosaminidase n=1 Tax=Candidatus Amphirhobacter heronislandensis TaxID=1732024 RepID=A0A930UEA2_9GAMM|nr:beta-N-acetylhexosaminidase [Betaproteobacteria bacterium AqS2]
MEADAPLDLTGRLMVGLDGLDLTEQDHLRLRQPAVGGVCLFARNYDTTGRLVRLVKDARACAGKPLAVGVDHEGGRVQRFVGEGFPPIAAPRTLGAAYERSREAAISEAVERGGAMAQQLRAVDIDFTFAPSLDIDYGRNPMIDSRCFAADPEGVAALGLAFCQGLHEHGMIAIGKHFPGHGWAKADTHLEVAVDDRSLDDLLAADLRPYVELFAAGMLDAVLVAHVHCRELAAKPSTYAPEIIEDLLRGRLGFGGMVMTDDLVMEGADIGLDMVERTLAARRAGCDLLLWCGGEPVLLDDALAELPAAGGVAAPWQDLLAKRS